MDEKFLILSLVATFGLYSIHAWIGQMRFAWLDDSRWRVASGCYRLFVMAILVAGAFGGLLSFMASFLVLYAIYGWAWYWAFLCSAGLFSGMMMAQWQSMKFASPVAGWFKDV